jgi:hypothetical protein
VPVRASSTRKSTIRRKAAAPRKRASASAPAIAPANVDLGMAVQVSTVAADASQ